MTIFLISSLAAIIISFLCSLTEAALLSLNKVKIETDRQKGLGYAITLEKLKADITQPIAAILILNTVAHTGGATIAGSAFDEIYGDQWIWLFSIVFTVVILLGTEILPKVLGVSYTDHLAKYMASPLKITVRALYPLIYLTGIFTKLIVKKKTFVTFSLEDIQTIAKVAQVEKIISKEQEDIILKTSNLKGRKIEDIMLPITEVIYLRENIQIDDFFALAEKHMHTRYPVSKTDSSQEIFGYLNFKEIALQTRDRKFSDNLQPFFRPILFIHNTQSIVQVLKDLTLNKYHLAIVKNEKGDFIGMVTLEDVVEEIVGEVVDEFDIE